MKRIGLAIWWPVGQGDFNIGIIERGICRFSPGRCPFTLSALRSTMKTNCSVLEPRESWRWQLCLCRLRHTQDMILGLIRPHNRKLLRGRESHMKDHGLWQLAASHDCSLYLPCADESKTLKPNHTLIRLKRKKGWTYSLQNGLLTA